MTRRNQILILAAIAAVAAAYSASGRALQRPLKPTLMDQPAGIGDDGLEYETSRPGGVLGTTQPDSKP